ncbi:hypothetical protein DGG96_10730 [Legionella qingyii]|uniref:Uncharacterized protein n=1 Tax=Legionella qingyii TaxID=2184757 RepID=A0A317U1F1_9GAMM|nr:hypothetical protein DGG96_10730 [Legionella qingyii]RUR21824.1 hypothetical protein ELY20_11440 [Legionella qingyii]RUR25248.1 hypothetical protein ELY16_09910 [Legionella qingyii]
MNSGQASIFSETQPVYLAIDRTNWYWGKSKINIFMLSVRRSNAIENQQFQIYFKNQLLMYLII